MKKTAVFIAAGTGMGADAAKHLSSKGYDIAIMSSSGKGEELAKKLGGFGFTGSNLITKDIEIFFEKVLSKFNKVDVVVNSAGHGPKGDILELKDEDWINGMEVYLLNVIRSSRIVTPINTTAANANVTMMWLVKVNWYGIIPTIFPISTNMNKEKTNGKYLFPLSPTVSESNWAIKLYISSEISCILEGIIDLVFTVKVKNRVITKTVISIAKDEFVKEML